MTSEKDPAQEVASAREAFEREFERFARFTSAALSISLKEAENERVALADLRTRHLGKKSAMAAAKKLIGRVAAGTASFIWPTCAACRDGHDSIARRGGRCAQSIH